MIMSRLGFWCKECACFRENTEDIVERHILAAKNILCIEREDPFASGLCSGFTTFEEVKRRTKKLRYKKASSF